MKEFFRVWLFKESDGGGRERECARALESMVMTFIESLSVRPENGEEPRKGGREGRERQLPKPPSV